MLRTEPTYLGRAKSLIAGGLALMAFVVALAVGTAGAPALGGLSWIMVTAGAVGVVYIGGVLVIGAVVDLRLRSQAHRRLRPVPVPVTHGLTARGDTPRSSAR